MSVMPSSFKVDLSGRRFGRLQVIGFVPTEGKNSRWRCQCDCGRATVTTAVSLQQGYTKSCGCYRAEYAKTGKLRHGHGRITARSREYVIWCGMLKRCRNPNSPAYPRYGGRGINVCAEWSKFENFLRDMGTCPEGASIERIDNDMGYSRDNCRWASSAEQNRNTRQNRVLEMPDGRRLVKADARAELNVSKKAFDYWLYKHRFDMAKVLQSLRERAENPKARRRVTGKERIPPEEGLSPS